MTENTAGANTVRSSAGKRYVVVARGGDIIKRANNLSVALLAAYGRFHNGYGSALVFDLRTNRIVAETALAPLRLTG